MNMNRRSNKKKGSVYLDRELRKNHFIMVCTMAVGLISAYLLMHSFTKTVYSVSERESLEHVLETAQQMNYSFQGNIEDTWKRMNMAQKALNYISAESVQSVVDYMSYIIDYTVMDSMYLLDRQGKYIDGSGHSGSWEINKDMLVLFEEEEPICMLRQNVTGEDSVVFGMPIDKVETEDAELEFMVSEYDLDTFMDVLKLKSYSGQGIVCVVDSEGRCLFSTSNSMPEQPGTYFLFSVIQDAEFTYNDEINNVAELKKKMELGDSGAVCITKDNTTYALSFTPLNIMDWSLVLIVDNDVISATRTDYVNKVGLMSIIMIVSIIIFCLLLYCLMTWISVKRTDQLLNNRDRMMNILSYDTMSSYMLVDEDDMICRYVSTGTYNVLGISAKELLGKSFENVVEVTGRNRKENILANALKNWNRETTLDTERFSFIDPVSQQEKFLRCKCFTPAEGKIVVTIMDESKEEQQERVLREAIMAAESANNAKSDFLSNMSHDIRTPMNAIMGFTTLLDKYADSEGKVREYTRKITAASKHLLGLINDVLDMSKIESGKATLNITEFRLSALIDEINSVLAPQAEARKQKFSVKCYGIEHDTLLGDRLHISQIIINLLSNSIKYTPEGGQIELTVCGLNTVSENYEHLRFEVKDTGIGMSEEFLKTIFEPFTREANSTTSGIRGTGLGMAITKNLVDLMGGAISVDSHPGKGSTFTVELELRISEHCVEEGQRITARKRREEKENNILSTDAVGKNELAGMNFLIAEDNAMNAEILSELIRLEGGISTIAHNGKEALEIFRNSSEKYFDVILMDIQMPVMNGYEATRAIRDCGKPEAKTIPILAMTANAFVEDVQNALAAGMNAHISKPVDLGMLKETVKKMIA